MILQWFSFKYELLYETDLVHYNSLQNARPHDGIYTPSKLVDAMVFTIININNVFPCGVFLCFCNYLKTLL